MVFVLPNWLGYFLALVIIAAFAVIMILVKKNNKEEEDEDHSDNFYDFERGCAMELKDLDDGVYRNLSETSYPNNKEKVVAILPDPDPEDEYEMLFINMKVGQFVPKKFEARGGRIIEISGDDKNT